MEVIEWVHVSDKAAQLDPATCADVRRRLSPPPCPVDGEAKWVEIMDLSLKVWRLGYEDNRRQRMRSLGL
jgi:hypothetical protein